MTLKFASFSYIFSDTCSVECMFGQCFSLFPVFFSLQASFPGNLHLVLVLRPTSFLQRTFTDIGFRFSQEDFMLKLPVRVYYLNVVSL